MVRTASDDEGNESSIGFSPDYTFIVAQIGRAIAKKSVSCPTDPLNLEKFLC
jgi:hypothetical protein